MDDEPDPRAASAESIASVVAAAAAVEAERAAQAAVDTHEAVLAAARAVAETADAAARAIAAAVEAKAVVVADAAAAAAAARQVEARLTHDVLHDELTGLPGRRLLIDRLTRALVRSKRTKTMVAVLYLDLDRFKTVNDRLGHAAGDALLVGVANRLLDSLRDTDTCARVGGDEFVIVCEDLNHLADGKDVVRRLTSALALGVLVGERSVAIRASIGLAMSSGASLPLDLLEEADAAMYRAKDEGRSWKLDHVHGNRWAIVNRTGDDALLVRLVARGSLLVFGVRDWSNSVERWPNDVSVEVVAQTAWRRNDPPELSIAWTADGVPDIKHELTVPWPRTA
jgi:diguanylate cyclase (GGDEF)-like protein